jgi:hypothetical protein
MFKFFLARLVERAWERGKKKEKIEEWGKGVFKEGLNMG